MQIDLLKPVIEAALLASSQPMTMHQLGDLFGEADDVNHEQIARTLEALVDDCEGRGIELKQVASGFRYQVRQDVHPWISRMWRERPSRYSRALMETLALIAYRQPITRPEIEQIRGVVVSSNIIKTMEEREWIRVVGHRDVPGKPALFGTTRAFLDYFNLKSLDQLPPLSEIRDLEDPQLRFEPDSIPARVARDLPIDPEAAANAEAAAVGDAAEAESDVAVGSPAAADDELEQAPADSVDVPGDIATNSSGDDEARSPEAEMDPQTINDTADEAAQTASVDSDDAEQDNQEYRA